MKAYFEINVKEFDRRTNNKWRGEQLELFKCPSCKHICLGLPDTHLAIIDPHDLSRTTAYSVPRETDCPICGSKWHDGGKKWLTDSVTRDELQQSAWSWLDSKQDG